VKKPKKKSDNLLYKLIATKIANGQYLFSKHAKQRQKDRKISDLDVLKILEGNKGRRRKRNKSRDKYEEGQQDWNYCFEGYDIDENKIRIILSFKEEWLFIVTVIRIKQLVELIRRWP